MHQTMAGSLDESLASLFQNLHDASSAAHAESQIRSFLQQNRKEFALACARVAIHGSDDPRLVSPAVIFLQRALTTNIPSFSHQEQELIKEAVFGTMKHPDIDVRHAAIGPITCLLSVACEDSGTVLSTLHDLISTSDSDESFHDTAFATLQEIYTPGFLRQLPANLTLPPLRVQIDFFYTVIGAELERPVEFIQKVLLTWRP
jgi:hypothetical protein